MRDMTIAEWPDYLAPLNMTVTMDRPLFKGPKPLDGREQVVAATAGGWLISYDGIPVYGEKFRTLRALLVGIGGLGKPIYVRPEYGPNMLARRNNVSAALTTFSDTTTYSDTTKFAQSVSDCVLAAAAVRGTRSLAVTNSSVLPVQVGDYFEIDGRLHVVQSIDGTAWKIWPPTRADYASGTILEIENPRGVMYLTPESAALALNMQFGRLSRVSVEFVEAGW